LKDYKHRKIEINPISQFHCILPSLYNPQIVIPWMHIGESNELFRFEYQEITEYTKMWSNYPKRYISEEYNYDN
jgi:hypothetical protein